MTGSISSLNSMISSGISSQASGTTGTTDAATAAKAAADASTANQEVTAEEKAELKKYGLQNDPSIKTSSDATAAIKKAKEAAAQQQAATTNTDKSEIKDTVKVSNNAKNALNAEITYSV